MNFSYANCRVHDTDGKTTRQVEMPKKSVQRLEKGGPHFCRGAFFSNILRSLLIITIFMVTRENYINVPFACAQDEPMKYDDMELIGIGYREQELQLAKGTNFESESPTGVSYASFAGGTHIFIKGVGLNFAPQKNTVRFTSHDKQVSFLAPALTEEDQFNSHPQLGSISYRIPSISEIFQGIPEAQFDIYQDMTFWISVVAETEMPNDALLECPALTKNNCKFIMRRNYTPHIYYISPRVTYYDSYTTIIFNPKQTLSLITDLDSDELPFINTKIGGNLLDFEFSVDNESTYASWYRNSARGQIGENTISKKQDISMQWETGKATINHQESTFCNFDQTDCYQAKSLPVIFDVSDHKGYTTGGQNITIKGYGFDSGTIDAKIDGQVCVVNSFTRFQFSCTVQAAPQASDLNKKYIGQHGISRKFVNLTQFPDYKIMESYEGEMQLGLNFESEINFGDTIGSLYKGWFVPPTDARYRFYMTCDDTCKVSIAPCPDTISPLTVLTEFSRYMNTNYRDYWAKINFEGTGKTWSEWIELKKGQHYYIEGSFAENGGGDHFSVAVEIEQSQIVGHHHAMKEMQELSVETVLKFEQTRITVENPDDQEYILVYKDPMNIAVSIPSEKIKGKATAVEFKQSIRSFYTTTLKSDINVELEMKDSNDLITTDQALATKYVYLITLTKLIDGVSTNSITFAKLLSTATVTIEHPTEVQISNPPLKGSFKVKCVDKNGQATITSDIIYSTDARWVINKIMSECPGLYDKLEYINSPNKQPNNENGIKVRFRFSGLNEDPGQFEILNSDIDPLTQGEHQLVWKSETVYPYGTNLFYNPIPFEFLKTFEEKPQLIVNVGDQPAVCHNMTCDFTYIEPAGEITGVTYDKTSKKLVITGTSLPSTLAPVDNCPTHATEVLCTADTTCAWASLACSLKTGRRILQVDDCSANTDSSTCSADAKCLWNDPNCVTDSCQAHLSDSLCKAESKCLWSGTACATDTCLKNSDSTSCGSTTTCLWTGAECNTDSCANHLDGTTCAAETSCEWNVSKCQISCPKRTSESHCALDSKCLWSSNACAPDTCQAQTTDIGCSAQASCLWLASSSTCKTDICNNLSTLETCNAQSTCIFSKTSTCETDKCSELTLNTEEKCLNDKTCSWDLNKSECNTHKCLTIADEGNCANDSSCTWNTATCEVENCQFFLTQTLCKTDSTCSWNGYNCGKDNTIKCTGRRILQEKQHPQRALAEVSTLKKVMFGQAECIVDESTLSPTNIECTMKDEPVCGNWDPEDYSMLGLIPLATGVPKVQVDCSVTSIFPTQDLNVLGFDNLTISGTNFPRYLADNTIDIEFSNALMTKCIPQVTDSTELVCLTQAFDKVNSLNEDLTIKITINGIDVVNSLALKIKQINKKGIQMSPTSISPVLKGEITFNLELNFPYVLKAEDFTVNATLIMLSTQVSPYYKQNQNTKVRKLSINSVDDTAKTISVVFGGAYSGTYAIKIRHSTFGLIDTEGLVLIVGSEVTSYSPNTGSIYGGTVLTIHGTNWDPEIKTNNPVQISYNGALANSQCYVLTTSETKITCRIQEFLENDKKETGTQGKVLVFLKTSEEAACVNPKCQYSFTNIVPTITAVEKEWDAQNNEWTIKVSGTDFTGTTETTDLQINGVSQTTTAVISTQAVFKITDITDNNLINIKIYFDVGIPKGRELLEAAITLETKLVSFSVQSGSPGGSLIIANVQGIGKDTKILDFVYGGSQSMCQSITIKTYGKVECLTHAKEIAAGSQMSIKLGDNSVISCGNSDVTKCEYKQIISDSMPAVVSVALTDSATITYIGTNFFTVGFDASASFNSIWADEVTITDAQTAIAKWNKGVPVSLAASAPLLKFTKTGGRRLLAEVNDSPLAHIASGIQTLANPLAITTSTQGHACSFAGGCHFEINAKGLATLLRDKTNNYVTVCDQFCDYSDEDSNSDKAVCKVPQISTTYSDSQYKITKSKDVLNSGTYFGSNADSESVFDGNLLNNAGDESANCHIGMSFKENHVGIISQVKYFLGDIMDKSIFQDKLKFQGSNDGTTYTDIFVVDENVHEGWNYYTWESSEYQKYRFYRFNGPAAGSCKINEIQFTGVETIQNSDPEYKCDVKLISNKVATSVQNQVTYQGTATPLLTSIEPRFGKVLGGTEVTFTGTSFSATKEDNTVTIDGIPCLVSASTTTTITCTTGSRPGLVKTSLEIYVKNFGRVSLQQNAFIYVNAWSDKTTWGGDFAPTEMETIYVPPGLNLLVDVEKTDVLNAVIVEGSLIFAPEADKQHHRYFDAHYIFIRNGSMEVGTEEHPYDSKITITMHSQLSDPFLPIYGNKVIGCRYCILDLHGPKREPEWTVLEKTSEAGENTITMQRSVDWKIGELIGVASTDFNGRHAEKRTITKVDNTNPDKPILTLDKPFEFKHFAMTQTYGTDTIDMRAEVGLLSRNVRIRGDPETSTMNQYGATIFLHSQGDDSLIARLENIEMTDVGQAFKVGRYAVHFHMIGAVHKSYARGCSTHEGHNRAYTIHGTHYLRLENNIAYHVKGHNVFIEDAAETKNYIKGNLIMKAVRSMSLLNTDQSPACFWITHPDNALIENHAAGSDRYSYWYDLQQHAMGPSANINICSENSKVGEFRDNHAHSNGRYGLRIFHNMVPRKFPCKPISDTNPYITANFNGLTSWKNNRNGAIAERVGDVRFNNFKTADNLLAGIEFSLTHEFPDFIGDDKQGIYNALIIGRSENTEDLLEGNTPRGIITPRTENFVIRGAKFFNFDWENAAAFGSCSHCFHSAATDSGARTVRMSGLEFTNVVKRIRWQFPHKAIYLDEDGSLTGKGPKTWATPYFKHHEQPECTTDLVLYDGVTCDSTIQIRRVVFWDYAPNHLFFGQGMKILKYDDNLFSGMDEAAKIAHIADTTNYATIFWKTKLDPLSSWATPFVTGHSYRIHWGKTGLNFEKMKATMSERWEATDKNIHFTHNFTDVRAAIEVTIDDVLVKNDSIAALESDWQSGQNLVRNITDLGSTEEQLLKFVVSPKGLEMGKEHSINFVGHRCIGSCNEDISEKATESFVRLWSDVNNWPLGRLPVEGEDVHILSGWNMTMDIPDTPIYRLIRVNGILNFKTDIDINFRAKHIFIRAGELNIGQKDFPYLKNCKIELFGEKDSKAIVYDNAIEAGNKLLANVNILRMFGKKRKQNWTRLLAPAEKGASQITVEKDLDLVAGDRIGLLPTSYNFTASDDCVVTEYDPATGIVKIDRSRDIKVDNDATLQFYHWGAEKSTGDEYNGVDMRGEVVILSRNIKIVGQDIESWGAQVVTSDTVEFDAAGDMKVRSGQSIIDSVEFFNCSQIDTQKTAVRFEGAATLPSSLTNSALHNGYSWGISVFMSKNILIKDNVLFNFRPIGINVGGRSSDITIDGNVVGNIQQRTTLEGGNVLEDKEGGIFSCTFYFEDEKCSRIIVTNNIVGGAPWVGYTIQGHECGKTPTNTGNVAHSINGKKGGVGFMTIPDHSNLLMNTECYESTGLIAYKNAINGAMYLQGGPTKAIYTGMTMIDNIEGLGLSMTAGAKGEYFDMRVELNNNKIYGEGPAPDCPQGGGYCYRPDKCGFMASIFIRVAKPLHPTAASKKPYHKAKSYGTWGGQAYLTGNEFINFKAKTSEGASNSIICLNHYGSDYIAPHNFYDTKFNNVDPGALAYIMHPLEEWANPKDCVEFPCTAPLNVLFSFKNTQYASNQQWNYGSSFQLIANNQGISPYLQNCRQEIEMNAYICDKEHLGTLMFESEDEDNEHRTMTPIYISLNGTQMANKLNSMMDHQWDGFYTGQTHLSRFPGLIDAIPKSVYNLTFTGTPAQKMRFSLRTQSQTASVILRIAYPSAQSRNIVKNGKIIEFNKWDEKLLMYGEVKGDFCGENRYIGVKNILEFYLDTTCDLRTAPRDAIQSLVRMEWTLDQFFADGGTTSFMDRVAGGLGIHASTIKIVSVYEGSLVVNYDIIDPNNNSDALEVLKQKQTQQFATGAMNLGAPILDVSMSLFKSSHSATQSASVASESIVTGGVVSAPGYTPIVISKVNSGSYSQGAKTFQTANSPASVQTSLSGDKVGTATQGIISHLPTKFNPNMKVVIDKNQLPRPVNPETNSESSQLLEVLSDVKENNSGTFILIAGVIIVLVFIALFIAKMMLTNTVRATQQQNIQISKLQDAKVKKFTSQEMRKEFKKVDQDEVPSDRVNTPNFEPNGPDSDNDDLHEQYNANQDFAIFAHKDKAVGGIMSLQEKQNIAEDMMNQSVESSEQDFNQASQNIQNLRQRLEKLEKETQEIQSDFPKSVEIEMISKEPKANYVPEDDEIQSLDQL